MQVVKRDGSLQEFDSNKIVEAISKAFNACCPEENKEVITSMVTDMHLWDGITIEEIQDVVIETLRDYGYDDVASAYSQYRSEQSRLREIIAKISYQDNYINSSENAATSSETDGNANVVSKNVATLESEDRKRENREIQRYRMKKKLKLLYPELSSQYARDLDSHIIYTHDEASTSVLKQYCMAVSLYPLMLEGVGNIDGVTPGPPNDLQSFSGQVTNLIFLLSSQCKGAVAVGSYFIALNYYIIAEYGEKWYEKLDFSDRREFANAERGWLDNAEGKVIYAEDGKFAWDLQSYGDLNRDAPDTVNPSLWRNTQLNAKAGLFEVCDGIYQVRGFDMANATFIRTNNGWIIFDVLMCKENMQAAKALMENRFGPLDVKAVLYSHSHVDHFGGAEGAIDRNDVADPSLSVDKQLASGKTVILSVQG